MTRGVILYGPPGAGKDTITAALHTLDTRYRLYHRLKAGSGRTTGYRMTTTGHIEDLRHRGETIWENARYGSIYVIDRPRLQALITDGVMPVIHLGQAEAIPAVEHAFPDVRWIITYLWCPREVAAHRIVARGNRDVTDRLQAWDETPPLSEFDCFIDTARCTPTESVHKIDELTQGISSSDT